MTEIMEHFWLLGTDEDKPEEDIVRSLLSVLGYSAQSLRFGMPRHKVIKHMRSERVRIVGKL